MSTGEVRKGPWQPVIDKNRPPPYFTPAEVSQHNTADDLWVSWLGNVYDLTPVSQANEGE